MYNVMSMFFKSWHEVSFVNCFRLEDGLKCVMVHIMRQFDYPGKGDKYLLEKQLNLAECRSKNYRPFYLL